MSVQQLNNPSAAADNGAQQQGFSWRIFGPGISTATAAIGGSASYSVDHGWCSVRVAVGIMIVLANVFKYPFFRICDRFYVYDTGAEIRSAGYAKRSKVYLWIYFILSILSAVIEYRCGIVDCAVILGFMLPEYIGLSTMTSVSLVIVVCLCFIFRSQVIINCLMV